MWFQKQINIAPKKRGFHLVTGEIEEQIPELKKIKTGLLHLSLKHTSASLTINENADPTVRRDFEEFFRKYVPDNDASFRHTLEGSDDMSAHIKSSILGTSLIIPVENGRLALGTWQGIYLGEHRADASSRTILLTLHGE